MRSGAPLLLLVRCRSGMRAAELPNLLVRPAGRLRPGGVLTARAGSGEGQRREEGAVDDGVPQVGQRGRGWRRGFGLRRRPCRLMPRAFLPLGCALHGPPRPHHLHPPPSSELLLSTSERAAFFFGNFYQGATIFSKPSPANAASILPSIVTSEGQARRPEEGGIGSDARVAQRRRRRRRRRRVEGLLKD